VKFQLTITIDDWLVVSTPLKNMKVSWYDYSEYMENKKMFQATNNQDVNEPFMNLIWLVAWNIFLFSIYSE